MRFLPCLILFFIFGMQEATPMENVPLTLHSLLEEMTDRNALIRFPVPAYTCKQFSSYDRGSVSAEEQDTWFANHDRGMYLRVEETDERKEWVMMDVEGPGAITRIWSANPEGTMRIYIDHEPIPVIEAPMAEALSGMWKILSPLSAERSKGYNLYLPIPYSKHCKVTSDAGDFYYQINYRTYEPGTRVESLTAKKLDQALPRIMAANATLAADISHKTDYDMAGMTGSTSKLIPGTSKILSKIELGSGESFLVQPHALHANGGLGTGPKVLSQIELWKNNADTIGFSRSLVLEAEFDGEKTIWCPLTDFLSMGAHAARVKDFYRSCIPEVSAISMWPMPYERECKLTLHNLGTEKENLSMVLHIEDGIWDDRSMHFYALWHYIHPVSTRPMSDWNYVDIQGKGVYVGDSLAVMNPSPIWWGEGDEKFYIDNETFPSHFGTGTEDYYGYAWCSNQLFEAPFHGQPRCDGFEHGNNRGHTTVFRVRALDSIPFTQSLKFDMEIWHWRECDMAYAATTYFYARPGAKHNRAPQPDAAAAPVPEPPPPFKIEGALECEEIEVTSKSGDFPIEKQDLKSYAFGKFSNEHHLFVQPVNEGEWIEIEFPALEAKKQHVTLYATTSWDYGIIRCTLNNRPVEGSIDLFSGKKGLVEPSGPLDLGVTEAVDGRIKLHVEVVGGNPASEGTRSFFGLDCIVLTPVETR